MSLFTNQPLPTGAPFGLRQRRDHMSAEPEKIDENADPNNIQTNWDGRKTNKVRPPPRAFLATAGKAALRSAAVMIGTSQALVTIAQTQTNESSLWVLAYTSFTTQAHYNALIRSLKSCGTITASRASRDKGEHWIAVRYNSELEAHKAACKNGSIINVGGSNMVITIMSFADYDVASQLGIDIHATHSDELGILSFSGVHEQILTDDSEVLLVKNENDRSNGDRSRFESICGKFLAWFFMW